MTKTTAPTGSYRQNHHIGRKQAQTLFRAVDYSIWIDRPLNYYAVINFTDLPAASPVTVFKSIRHKFRDWLAHKRRVLGNRNLVPSFIYTFENPEGMTHVNWMLRIEGVLQTEFEPKLNEWLQKAQGICGKFDVSVQPIEPGTEKTTANYFMKGIHPAFAEHFFLEEVCAPQGIIWGQRTGASMNISVSARRADGFIKAPRIRFQTPNGIRRRTPVRQSPKP